MHYIVYFLDGSHRSFDSYRKIEGNEERELKILNIDVEDVDYLVNLPFPPSEEELKFKKYMPDGSAVWNRAHLIDYKIKQFLEKRKSIFEKLDFDFMISLEKSKNPETELIIKNKNFLRDLSIRDELDSIHDCEKLFKLNAFYNLIKIDILDPGFGCGKIMPKVFISDPKETFTSCGLGSVAECVIDHCGRLISIEIVKIGCGYISTPSITIEGYENARHPKLSPVIVNKV